MLVVIILKLLFFYLTTSINLGACFFHLIISLFKKSKTSYCLSTKCPISQMLLWAHRIYLLSISSSREEQKLDQKERTGS